MLFGRAGAASHYSHAAACSSATRLPSAYLLFTYLLFTCLLFTCLLFTCLLCTCLLFLCATGPLFARLLPAYLIPACCLPPFFVAVQELLAIQQEGARNLGFFGTRNMGFMHQQLIEILSYAMIITVSAT